MDNQKKYKINEDYFDKEYLEFIMIMYRLGGEDKSRAESIMIGNLEGYIIDIIKKSFSTYVKEHFNDLRQEGRMAIIQNMHRYDPKKARPTTFFKNYIISNLSSYITEYFHQNTPHYRDAETKLRRFIQEYSMKNNGEAPSVDVIIESTGISPQTIKVISEQKVASNHVYLDVEDRPDYPDQNQDTPEDFIIKKEKYQELYYNLNKLDPDTKTVICMKYGLTPFDREHNYHEIYQETGISPDNVATLHNKGLQKLRRSNAEYAKKAEAMIDDLMKLNNVPNLEARYDDSYLEEGDWGEKVETNDGRYGDNEYGEDTVLFLEEMPEDWETDVLYF